MNLYSFAVHCALMGVSTVGTGLVIWGLVKESWKERQFLTAVIIFGTALEVLCTLGLLLYDESLSRGQDAKIIAQGLTIKQLGGVAAKAKSDADAAGTAAGQALTNAAGASNDASNAIGEAANALVDARRAQGEVVAVASKASDLQTALAEDEKLLTPRRWAGPGVRGAPTLAGLGSMIEHRSALASFKGMHALIQQATPDFGASTLANDIGIGLLLAGWSPALAEPQQTGIASLAVPEGISIWTRPKTQDPRAWNGAEALATSFRDEGITGEREGAPLHQDSFAIPVPLASANDIRRAAPKDTVVILVGASPLTSALWNREAQERRAAKEGAKK